MARKNRKNKVIDKANKIGKTLMVLAILFGMGYVYYRVNFKRTVHVTADVTYGSMFNDLQDVHLPAAQRFGISPVDDRSYSFDDDDELCRIRSCSYYELDNLTHSVPYLTHAASDLLESIGSDFKERLRAGGYRTYKVIVTSVLRTRDDVRRLQRVNGNATENSAHCYGTTFDITYARYKADGISGRQPSPNVLSETLAEVLKQKRGEGLCFVKFERNQHCFHITSRG